ncbi:PAAR-like domain-containing protein [Sorangium sp. So ce1128]
MKACEIHLTPLPSRTTRRGPPPAPAPVPVPYPSIGLEPTNVGFVPNVLMTCAPAHNMSTQPALTNGAKIMPSVTNVLVLAP